MKLRPTVLTIGGIAAIVLGVVFAQTIATRTFPINGTYWISLPASPNPPVTNAEQLLAYGPFTSVARLRTATDTIHTWNGTTCTPAVDPDSQGPNASCTTSCFCVTPGEGYQATVSGAPRDWAITGADGVAVYQLLAPGPGSATGKHLISFGTDLPPGVTAYSIMLDIGGGVITPVTSISRYVTATDTIQAYTGRMGAGIPFALVPGEAYRVQMNTTVPSYNIPNGATFKDPCIEPQVAGTIRIPPTRCAYFTPAAVHLLLEGLPTGTTVLLDASHQRFFNITPSNANREALTTETFDSDLDMRITGTGILSAVDCNLVLPLHAIVESQPAQPGQAVQDFDADMKSLTGSLPTDSTCNLFQSLTVQAGTNHGLPSPGHVHLERRPDGTFDVSSFFDINVTMSFVGKAGSLLDGMSGSTTQVVKMGTASNLSAGIALSPGSATVSVGANHTVTAKLEDLVGHPKADVPITFSVTSGPNAGATGTCSVDASCKTDATGNVSLTYTSNGRLGTDQINACFRNRSGQQSCSISMVNWACLTNGTTCDDGNACTTNDACLSGSCQGASGAAGDVGPSLRLQGHQTSTIDWLPASGATGHDVLRGLLSGLPVGPGGGDEVCLADNVAAPTASDTTIPAVGSPFWYLVRGENPCGVGSYGFAGILGATGAPRISTTCP